MPRGAPLKTGGCVASQEDGADQKLSVFHLFSELFPEYANDKDRDGSSGKNGLMRLQVRPVAVHPRRVYAPRGDAAPPAAR